MVPLTYIMQGYRYKNISLFFSVYHVSLAIQQNDSLQLFPFMFVFSRVTCPFKLVSACINVEVKGISYVLQTQFVQPFNPNLISLL